jgi:hypothetical protein
MRVQENKKKFRKSRKKIQVRENEKKIRVRNPKKNSEIIKKKKKGSRRGEAAGATRTPKKTMKKIDGEKNFYDFKKSADSIIYGISLQLSFLSIGWI